MNGFIKTILLIVVALVVLGALGYDVRDLLNKPIIKDNLIFAWNVFKDLWFSYIQPAVYYIWEHALQPLWNWMISILPEPAE